jgi:hypothetical protein
MGRQINWIASSATGKVSTLTSKQFHACPLPALRRRTLRSGMSGVRNHAFTGRIECHDVQQVRGDAILCQQLPAGQALQFL